MKYQKALGDPATKSGDENDSKEIIEEFHDAVWKWAEKYNVELERLDKKPIYYILGVSN